MIAKIVALFALIAVALAAPKPEPSPQYLVSGLDSYVNPYVAGVPAYPSVVSPYAAPAPLAYSAYTGGAYFVR